MVTRRQILAVPAALASTCLFLAIGAHADITAYPLRGRTVPWTGILPGAGWIGGNVDQIKGIASHLDTDPKSQGPRELLDHLLQLAEQCDVYMINLDDGQTKSNTITTLEVSTLDEAQTDFSDAGYRSKLANVLAKPPLTGASGSRIGTQAQTGTQIVFAKQATTGGKPAFSVAIRVDLADQTAFYVVYQLVVLGDGRWHTFDLTVDADHYTDRLDNLNQLLATVQYKS